MASKTYLKISFLDHYFSLQKTVIHITPYIGMDLYVL